MRLKAPGGAKAQVILPERSSKEPSGPCAGRRQPVDDAGAQDPVRPLSRRGSEHHPGEGPRGDLVRARPDRADPCGVARHRRPGFVVFALAVPALMVTLFIIVGSRPEPIGQTAVAIIAATLALVAIYSARAEPLEAALRDVDWTRTSSRPIRRGAWLPAWSPPCPSRWPSWSARHSMFWRWPGLSLDARDGARRITQGLPMRRLSRSCDAILARTGESGLATDLP